MVRIAAAIGVVATGHDLALVVEQPVKDIRGFAGGRRDHLGARETSCARRTVRRGASRQGVERGSERAHQRVRHPAGGLLPDHSRSAEEPIPSYAIIPGLNYSDDLIVLEIRFISGRPKEKRLSLLKALNDAVVSAAAISPDDLLITLYETPGENISFGRGLAQRASVADQEARAAYAAGG
jgi:Tautomerase enzyme